ncbi:MAG: Nramp family divalent metal transporter [Candidatus Nomurabacteria bacterium]|nr:MAG: Nramp family divalent metal transporter [Candidatus Nomurabacteria bacterium]
MKTYPKLTTKILPPAPPLRKALGVGVVVMGLAIGTGELILWPHLVTKYGLHLLWMALLGISFQYFINQEVARHALATGEGFFLSSARVLKWTVWFWLASAILLYIWPGWASAIGTMLAELFGFGGHLAWSWIALGFVLVLTFSGRAAYTMLERSLKITVPSFFILLVVISVINLSGKDLADGLVGLLSFGKMSSGVDTNVLLSAVVFAGAGGMLNLAVSLWYRDKQFGMAKYGGRIENPVTGKTEAVAAAGHTFAMNKTNLKRWEDWMRFVRVDQGVIFWLLGLITLFLLSLNAYVVLKPQGIIPEGLDVAIAQANIFGEKWGAFGYNLFLVMATLMLFSVMWTVIDALTRMVSTILYENAHIGPYQQKLQWLKKVSLSKFYYTTIVLVVISGAALLPLEQPLTLLVISAVLGGLTMAVYTPLLIYLNNARLPKALRPSWPTNVVMVGISAFFIYFAIRVIIEQFHVLTGL